MQAEERTGPFIGITSTLRASPILGIYLNMHSLIDDTVVHIPAEITLNKNNLAPLGFVGWDIVRTSPGFTHLAPEEIAQQLTRDFTVCYTLENYIDRILTDPNFKKNEEGKIIYTSPITHKTVSINEYILEGACKTIEGIEVLLNKIYETNSKDGYPPEFTIAFSGKTCNLIDANIETFCETFEIDYLSFNKEQFVMLSKIFENITFQGYIDTNDLLVLMQFFNNVFNARVVNIFDLGCNAMLHSREKRHLTKRETEDAVLVSSMIFGKSNIGFGGTKKKINVHNMLSLKFKNRHIRKSKRRNKRKMRGGDVTICPNCKENTYDCGSSINGPFCTCSNCGKLDTPWATNEGDPSKKK
jgi:hypothetical protein